MALPPTQTADLIKTEGYKRSGILSPTATELTDADVWLRECLNAFYKQKDFKVLEDEYIRPLSAYTQEYSFPSDFDKELDIRIFYGTESGTATAGGATSLTLAADEDIDDERIKGKLIFLTSGTNANQKPRVTAYSETTKVATTTAWATTPAGDEAYIIVENKSTVLPSPRETIDDVVVEELPKYYYIYNDKLYFSSVVDDSTDQVWVMRYEVDLHYIDLTDSRMTTLYNELQEELTQGIYAYSLNKENDVRAKTAMSAFRAMVREYKKKDSRKRRVRGYLQMKSTGGMPV